MTTKRVFLASQTGINGVELSFSGRLRQLLFNTRITNKEFAELVNTGEGTVSRWLNGKQRPGRRRIAQLEQLLGLEQGTLSSGPKTVPAEQGLGHAGCGDPMQVPGGAAPAETPDCVMVEFNRWLEPYIGNAATLKAIDAVWWMQRMWRASSAVAPGSRREPRGAPSSPEQLLDIDVEPGTGIAITTNRGRIVVVNHALMDMLEMPRDDLVGRYVWELNAAAHRHSGQDRILKQLTEPWDLELVTGSGSLLPVTISNVHCHLDGNPVRVALVKVRGDSPAG